MGILILILVIVIIAIIIIVPDRIRKNKALESYINFASESGLKCYQSASLTNIARIDVDNQSKLVGVYSYYESESTVLKFNEILDFEVVENGNSVLSSKTGSAVVGGLLFGGVGAVAGASGSRAINENCNTLKLKIYTSNIKNSVITIDFLDNSISKNNPFYDQIIEIINKMVSLLKIIKEQNRQKERIEDKNIIIEKSKNVKKNNDLSNLKELAELKEKGIITEKEFEESKKKILEKI